MRFPPRFSWRCPAGSLEGARRMDGVATITGTLLVLAPLLAAGLGPGRTWLRQASAATALRPQDAALTPSQELQLFRQLDQGDQRSRPRMTSIPGPGGGVAITYRREPGETPLTATQLHRLVANPPSYEKERVVITALLQALRRLGVTLVLGPPRKSGALAEWEPKTAVLRIRPDAANRGSRSFARMLNHEAIHVAQSCSSGRLRSMPKPLGLPRPASAVLDRQLSHRVYASASPTERIVEQEAYANHNRLDLSLQLLRRHCRPGAGQTGSSESGKRAGSGPGRLPLSHLSIPAPAGPPPR
ncbi:hypothetical protein VB716_05915 [Synechococcus sp. CCY9201]|uniref:hypothetical protein n=1 Tax=Synechococcus sp. CCY9201 TaxID=174697 RepID=UPI002B1F40A0|nr:hypothetical protein [Synechococcus sp. CCY9201]MEA5473753.1 hypothetical protein [Synechococcus sp. CCY9201]